MSETVILDPFKLPNPPIMEAVLDIECDLPATLNFDEVERLGIEAYGERYPIHRKQFIQQAGVEMKADSEPKFFSSQGLSAFQFVSEDEKEVVQIRVGGFSYNRLAPYVSLDTYLPEISRCWDQFCKLASPVQIRRIGLRYINRMEIPTSDGSIKLDEYLKVSPNLPIGSGLEFTGFFHQHQAVDPTTGIMANIILANQPIESKVISLLLDIEVFKPERLAPAPLSEFQNQIESLRNLKNHIFEHSLTKKCLNLFQ